MMTGMNDEHDDGQLGFLYLLHLDPPYKHARHYLGWTRSLLGRVQAHRTGRSNVKLLKAARQAGCTLILVRTWAGRTRNDERRMKGNTGVRLCPLCRHEKNEKRNNRRAAGRAAGGTSK